MLVTSVFSSSHNVFKNYSLTLSQTTNFRHSQTKESADENLKLDENGKIPFKRVENTAGKEEIASYYRHVKQGLIWEKVTAFLT